MIGSPASWLRVFDAEKPQNISCGHAVLSAEVEHADAKSSDLSHHADLTGGQPRNEPAFMPAYQAARSRVDTQSAPV
jgi:hypothetical protein